MSVHIGITGTREGCKPGQLRDLLDVLMEYLPSSYATCFHFGDCWGVDHQGFHLAKALGFVTTSHPPTAPKLRAWCEADVLMPEKPYMVRNQDIVNAVSLLIVVPSGPEADNPRSGTWATYRMAVKAGVETVVIEP